jgi:hypothetical protein
MIKPDARLSIKRIPIERIHVKLHGVRYLDRLALYMDAMDKHPDHDVLLNVAPDEEFPGTYYPLDGNTRYCACIMKGRKDVLCVVIEEAA